MSQADSPSTMDIVLSGLSPDELKTYKRYVEPATEYIKPEGKMYEVEIQTPADTLLNYDKRLSEQSDFVKKALGDSPLKDKYEIGKEASSLKYGFYDKETGFLDTDKPFFGKEK